MQRARSWSRRNFLKSAGATPVVASIGALTNACGSIGRIIEGDQSALSDRVVIVGGGVSGLVAARELKKSGIAFRLFEGSSRIGGRCLSLEEFNQAGQTADMGAEWISEEHEFVRNLCRELRIELSLVPEVYQNIAFFDAGEVEGSQKLSNRSLILDKKLLALKDKYNDQQWNSLSTEQMLADLKPAVDEKSLLWIRRIIQLEWGCEPQQLSALAYFDRFRQRPSGRSQLLKKKYKIAGGTSILAKALHDRVAGIIPGQLSVLEHRLIEIDKVGNQLELTFSTPKGNFTVNTRVLILALPFSILRGVRGLARAGLSEMKIKIIEELPYGSHGKIVASFADRFWSKKYQSFTGDIESQWIWESSIVRGGPMQARRGLLTAQMGGHAGRELNSTQMTTFKSNLARYSLQTANEEDSIAKSWIHDPWAKGSVSFFAPGQAMGFANAISASENNGRIIFAGEHTSTASMGSLNGAVESGIRAAMEAVRMKSELTRSSIL